MTDDHHDDDITLSDEPFQRRRKHGGEEAEMDITPMIDITFLLLIFFLVASRMDADSAVHLPLARNGTAVTMKHAVVLTIAEGSGERADVYTGDGKIDENLIQATELEAQEAAVAEYVRQALQGGNIQSILLKAERGVRHREVARVTSAVGSVREVHRDDIELHVAVLEGG